VSRALRQSSLVALARPVADRVAKHPGLTIVTAALTHVILMAAGSHPPSWYWLILPLMFAAMGAVLWLMIDERRSA
jgi:hypothetical protein